MRDTDQQADNIFSRLISYTPRLGSGGRQRVALEDYYTEALAWCLRSPGFRKTFFDLIREGLPADKQLLFPHGNEIGVEVHTQLGFKTTDAQNEAETEVADGMRRFDLVIHSSASSGSADFVIVVEDKVKWHFTDNQIPAYQAELEKGRLNHYQLRLLVLLSPSGADPHLPKHPIPVVPMRWSAVQQKLAEFSGLAHLPSGNQMNLSAVHFVCAQFASFLKEKGLFPMNLERVSDDRLQNCVGGLEFREKLAIILDGVRSEGNRQRLKKDPVFDQSDDGSRWFGLYGSNPEDYFYVGFKLRDKSGDFDFCMFIQIIAPSKNPHLVESLEAIGAIQDGNDLNFLKKITDTEFDGNADKIRGWFIDSLAKIDSIRQ